MKKRCEYLLHLFHWFWISFMFSDYECVSGLRLESLCSFKGKKMMTTWCLWLRSFAPIWILDNLFLDQNSLFLWKLCICALLLWAKSFKAFALRYSVLYNSDHVPINLQYKPSFSFLKMHVFQLSYNKYISCNLTYLLHGQCSSVTNVKKFHAFPFGCRGKFNIWHVRDGGRNMGRISIS